MLWRSLYHGCSEILDLWLFIAVEDLEEADLAFSGPQHRGYCRLEDKHSSTQ
jgi:hypothetical protein